MVKTKIIATMGPSTDSLTVLRKMIRAGLDIARLNFSHGTWDDHRKRIVSIRSLNRAMRRSIKIMQDLEGFRMRVGRLKEPVTLRKRSLFCLTKEPVTGNSRKAHFDYPGSPKKIKKGSLIYIDDGKIILRVKSSSSKELTTEVVVEGVLKERKGINIPGISLQFNTLTKKDRLDVRFAIEHKLDYVAQSFVRNAGDIRELKRLLRDTHPACKIFAKIESKEALAAIDGIIAESDGIIVARGDMGICVPIYKVPVIQKELIKKCLKAKKPVVVATQMLDSMTTELFPTRAEVTDVANAILDGAGYVLVSAETAVGKHPHLVIDMMNRILKYTEEYSSRRKAFRFSSLMAG